MNARDLELRIHWAHEKLYEARHLAQLKLDLKKVGKEPPSCLRKMVANQSR